MTTTIKNLLIAFLFTALVGTIYVLFELPNKALGSVTDGNNYIATTTFAASSPSVRLLKGGQGAIAQVTITGKNTGLLTLYNATTSDVNLRTGQVATSSITIADFGTNAPEGTYTFDAQFTTGLLLVTSGLTPTTTVTWR